MNINDLINRNNVAFHVNASTKEETIKHAVSLLFKSGIINDKKKCYDAVLLRESKDTTGVGNNIAIPHCCSESVNKASLAIIKLDNEIDWQSFDDKPVKIVFLIVTPKNKDNVHLDVLAKLSSLLAHEDFINKLLNVKDIDELYTVIDKYENSQKDKEKKQEKVDNLQKNKTKKPLILAVTACPTGVAHTYMAKEQLEKAAEKLNADIKVQTNGASGAKNIHTKEEILNAKAVIIAADAYVDMSVYDNKPLIECGTKQAIKNPENLVKAALKDDVNIYHNTSSNSSDMFTVGKGSGKGHEIYKHLMSGISHMIPFVVAGGIILAISYLIDGICGCPKEGMIIDGVAYGFGSVNPISRVFHDLGATFGLGLMLPVLGGFIAYSIAGKAGLVSGFIGSFTCTKGTFSLLYFISVVNFGINDPATQTLASSSAGFIGAIFAGFFAGYFTRFMQRKLDLLPYTFAGIRDMLIVPFVSTIFVGLVMLILNVPFGYINIGFNILLTNLKDAGLVFIVAALVAGLMAIDMGGPINKAAHYFVLGIVTEAVQPGAPYELQTLAFELMAANIIGIMVPPVGISIASWLFPQKFKDSERAPALANCFIGCCGITEGAIPYVITDPLVIVVSCMTGSSIGGIVSMLLGMQTIAPEGGCISYFVMGVECWKGILALLIGALITATLIGLLKKNADTKYCHLGKWKGISIGRK